MKVTFVNIILILCGAVCVLAPNVIWKIKGIGRYNKEDEATPFMIKTIRITGVLALLTGIILFFGGNQVLS